MKIFWKKGSHFATSCNFFLAETANLEILTIKA
jgi:hypothetical protein